MRHTLLALVLASNAFAQANPWIFLDSAETASPPRLVLELEGGVGRLLTPVVDTVLIAYLGDQSFPQLPQLSIDTSDQNRSLLRFELPADLKIVKAVLVAKAHPSQLAPPGDTTFRVHLIEAAWTAVAKWNDAPAHAKGELATVRVPFGGGEISVDLTATAQQWQREPAKNFGILLRGLQADGPPKPTKPGPQPGETPMQKYHRQQALNERLVHCLPWQTDAMAARKKAEAEGKLVFAFVIADVGPAGSSHERALAVNALLDPDLAWIGQKFVPLRLQTHSRFHLGPKPVAGDPLAALGTDGVRAKAPALVVCKPDGSCTAVLASIGTWGKDLVNGFLADATLTPEESRVLRAAAKGRVWGPEDTGLTLPEKLRLLAHMGKTKEALALATGLLKGSKLLSADARLVANALLAERETDGVETLLTAGAEGDPVELDWLRGELAWLLGDEGKAQQHWLRAAEAAPPDSLQRLRAELRAEFARGIDEVGAAQPVHYDSVMATTERPVEEADREQAIQGAIAWLLDRQQRDGRFAHAAMPTYDAAITSLAGKALHVWGERMPEPLRKRTGAALERAESWCADYLKQADPATADSFGAGYLVDFLVARAAGSERGKALVPAAIALLNGGQLANGTWSYSKQFGDGWRGGFGGWPKTDKGRAHSINSGIALWALANARAAGFAVPEDRLKAGIEGLQQMQESKVTFTYTYPEPRSFTARDQSIGKAPVCLQALVALGAAKNEDLEQAVADFMQWRDRLRQTVKLTPSWIGGSGTSSYFFLHAYYHAAEAVAAAGGPECKKRLGELGRDLLASAEVDGTWLDFEDSGKTYGTAMALLVLARSR